MLLSAMCVNISNICEIKKLNLGENTLTHDSSKSFSIAIVNVQSVQPKKQENLNYWI